MTACGDYPRRRTNIFKEILYEVHIAFIHFVANPEMGVKI
jgi:hypothetical protein